jgi:hypothetical protein
METCFEECETMVHLKRCYCPAGDFQRVQRSRWMRLFFPSRRLYACADCRGRFLLPASHGKPASLQQDPKQN